MKSLLSLKVLGNEEPGIIRNPEKIAGVLEKRVIAERASSREGKNNPIQSLNADITELAMMNWSLKCRVSMLREQKR